MKDIAPTVQETSPYIRIRGKGDNPQLTEI